MAGLFHIPRRLADGSDDGAAAQVRGRRMLGVRGDGEALVCAGRRLRLRGTLGALVEMLGYIPESDTVRIVRNKGGYLVQPELPETVGEEICGYAGETHTEEIRPTGLRMGLNFLMQKRNGEIVGVVPRGANLDVRRYAITAGGIVRQEDGDTGERLYRRGYRPREDTDSEATLRKWRHLEVMSWCDWDAPEE